MNTLKNAKSAFASHVLIACLVGLLLPPLTAGAQTRPTVINILLDTPPTEAIVRDLGRYGTVLDVIMEINSVVLQADADAQELASIRQVPHVVAANVDVKVEPFSPEPTKVRPDGLAGGRNTWNMDAVNVTDLGLGRTTSYNGEGAFVAVLDTGLSPGWRSYFSQQSIAVGFARYFTDTDRTGRGGFAGSHGWEQDPGSHGTYVTAMILGYQVNNPYYSLAVQGPKEGVAPEVKVIPVRVVNDAGEVPSSILARGLVYVASLKRRELAKHPVIANISIAYRIPDPVLRAAVDYAIANGVITVAAAGNSGLDGALGFGLRYPAGWPEVISVGASGWTGQFQPGEDGIANNWWREDDVPDPLRPEDFYITDFSTRAAPGEDLDIVAPGTWVFGPAQGAYTGGFPDHLFGGGTSVSTPHVAGILALMVQKNPSLNQSQAEVILEQSAVPLPSGCRIVIEPIYNNSAFAYCWQENASGAGLADAQRALELTPLP